MPGFPLLALPLLAREEVFKRMRLPEILTLSNCSKKTVESILEVRIPIRKLTFSDLQQANLLEIVLSTSFGCYTFFLKSRSTDRGTLRTEWPLVGGYPCFSDPEHVEFCFVFYPDDGDFFTACDRVIGHLLKPFVLRAHVVSVVMRPCRFLTNWALRKHSGMLLTVHSLPSTCRQRCLPADGVELVLDNTKGSVAFGERVIDADFRYSRGLSAERVNIQNAHWLDFSAILNSNSKNIDVGGLHWPSAAQLHALLTRWLRIEGMDKLKELRIQCDPAPATPSLEEILEGIESCPYANLSLPPNRLFNTYYEWKLSGRVVRRTDGKKATVFVDESGFKFAVEDFSKAV